jgi:hypothetical protein
MNEFVARKGLLVTSGNVGIGTIAPGQALTLGANKNIRLDWGGGTDTTLEMYYDESYRQGIKFEGNNRRVTLYSYRGDGSNTDLVLKDGNVGIGTTSPLVKLQSNISTSGLPATSGTTQTNGALRLSSAGTSGVLDFGINSSNNWIQSTDGTDLSQKYNLLLNPNGGNVGIGTTSPSGKLHVGGVGSAIAFDTDGLAGANSISTTESFKLSLKTIRGTGSEIKIGNENLELLTNSTERMRITSTGNVGIGTTSPSYQLQLSTDSAAKPSTNTWTIASDSRVKENINPYTKGLDVIMSINPVTYDYNGKAGFEKIKNNVGVIAQEIKDVLPEGISTYLAKLNEDDIENTELYNFNSHALTYVLINAIKELKNELETLKNK